jgi:ESF2/ABP1 family protein
MDPNSVTEFSQELDKTGVVYLSSIPPGMAPHDIRTHLTPFGAIGRLYLAPLKRNADPFSETKKRKNIENELEAHKKRTKFVEGWIEFIDKKNALSAALALNGSSIATSNPRQRDCIWCIKYLKGFKWINLTEQLTLDRANRDKKLRAERRRARRENEHYLAQVDKAHARRRAEERNQDTQDTAGSSVGFEELRIKFKQRKPIIN